MVGEGYGSHCAEVLMLVICVLDCMVDQLVAGLLTINRTVLKVAHYQWHNIFTFCLCDVVISKFTTCENPAVRNS